MLLSLCGTAVNKTIRSVLTPLKPTEVTYNDLMKKLTENFLQHFCKLCSVLNSTPVCNIQKEDNNLCYAINTLSLEIL